MSRQKPAAPTALRTTDLFVLPSLECPVGWYGPNCQTQCACEHACPCDRKTGSCNITYGLALQEQLNNGTASYSSCALKNPCWGSSSTASQRVRPYWPWLSRARSRGSSTPCPQHHLSPLCSLFSSWALFGFPGERKEQRQILSVRVSVSRSPHTCVCTHQSTP